MKRMTALRAFTDASTGVLVPTGAEFECEDGAAERLAEAGIARPSGRKGARPTKGGPPDEADAVSAGTEPAEARKPPARERRGRASRK